MRRRREQGARIALALSARPRDPPGIHVVHGVPHGCGWRANDVIVDWLALGSLLFTYGRQEGDATVDLDPVDWSLSWRGRTGRAPLPSGKTELAQGLFVDVVTAPSLISEPRIVHGRWVVGPRAVSFMHGALKVAWDVVDASAHQRLVVEARDADAREEIVREGVMEPRGLDLDQLGPRTSRDDDGDVELVPGPYGPVGAEVAKRIALELADASIESAWIGWDGVVRCNKGPRGVSRTALEMFARLHASFHFEQRFGPAPRFMEDAFHATTPASSDHLAALVRNLRPEWSRVREQYVEELAILSGQLKGA